MFFVTHYLIALLIIIFRVGFRYSRNIESFFYVCFHFFHCQFYWCITCFQWRTQKIFMGISFSGVRCHLYWVCVLCDVIIWRHIHVFQTNVLAKFALISHSRQIKTIVLDKVNYRGTQS